jgi:hypothetical protein
MAFSKWADMPGNWVTFAGNGLGAFQKWVWTGTRSDLSYFGGYTCGGWTTSYNSAGWVGCTYWNRSECYGGSGWITGGGSMECKEKDLVFIY